MKHSLKIIFKYLIFGISTIILGLLNYAWHSYSDYKISYWIAEKIYKINLVDYWSEHGMGNIPEKENIWFLNSLYIDLTAYSSLGYIVLWLLLMITSGFIIT